MVSQGCEMAVWRVIVWPSSSPSSSNQYIGIVVLAAWFLLHHHISFFCVSDNFSSCKVGWLMLSNMHHRERELFPQVVFADEKGNSVFRPIFVTHTKTRETTLIAHWRPDLLTIRGLLPQILACSIFKGCTYYLGASVVLLVLIELFSPPFFVMNPPDPMTWK